MKKKILLGLLLLLAITTTFANGKKETTQTGTNTELELKEMPKYVFVFIGDGMALPQVGSAEIYQGALNGGEFPDAPRALSFTKFPVQGIVTTHDSSSFIPDSASTGTSIATGHKTLAGVISMDEKKEIPYKSIAKLAKEKGKKVGVVSSVSIDHATPAVFYANVPSRGMYYEIGLQLAESDFDYFGGGSLADPDGKKSKMENKPGNVFDYAKQKGYNVVNSVADFNALQPAEGQKVWAVTEAPADGSALLYEIDRQPGQLSLADFTQKGIELLDNPNGFFMAVESGKIDWACHANDAMAAIKDVFAFNDAIQKAIDFANKHPEDTLIIVTGDHETGGMAIGFSGTKYGSFFEKLQYQKMSYVKFDEVLKKELTDNSNLTFETILKLTEENFGLTKNETETGLKLSDYELSLLEEAFKQTKTPKAERNMDDAYYLAYGSYEPYTVKVTHILNQKAGIGWTTYSHTGTPVPIYAYGVGSSDFTGYYDNTEINKKLVALLN